MKNGRRYHTGIVALDILFLLFACAAVIHITQKATLPPEFSLPLSLNGVAITDGEQLEFVTSWYRIGDSVRAVTAGAPQNREQPARLVPYYPASYIALDTIISLVIFLLGLIVYLFRPAERDGRIFHLASTATAVSVLAVKTVATLNPPPAGAAAALVFFCAYGVLPVLFLHFTCIFPNVRMPRYRTLLAPLYALGCVIALVHLGLYLRAQQQHALLLFDRSLWAATVQDGFIFVVMVAGVFNFIASYARSETAAERKKLRWILCGLCLGPTPFLFLWFLPRALGSAPFGSEVVLKHFLLLVPAAFTISILRHRLLDIDLLVNRGAVYVLVIGTLLLLYALLVGGVTVVFENRLALSQAIPFALAAVAIALAFDPLRRFAQRVVDRSFFRVEYNFRTAQRMLSEEIARCLTPQEIGACIVRRMEELLPVERMGVFTLDERTRRLRLLGHRGFETLEARGVEYGSAGVRSGLGVAVALPDVLEPGIRHEPADRAVFTRWNVALAIPLLKRVEQEVQGFLVLGRKKSGLRFTVEDIDLLNAVGSQAGLSLERLALQEKVLLEHAETERLEELNQLKSYFVSSVSHDMKTPLTSISMFAELLQSKERSPGEVCEYLQIIRGETERLTRLINNVLDFSRIERGVKEYVFAETDLNALVQNVLASIRYQFAAGGFSVSATLSPGALPVRADADAVTEALLNLLSNAMKYSPGCREIGVTTFSQDGDACIRVCDKGMGMPPEEIDRIFEPFYRTAGGRQAAPGGTGLGLAIVRHTIDAHGGTLDVQSAPGEGSAFTLRFPGSLT